MSFKEIAYQLDIVGQCRKYGLSIWQCPQFLFLLMGIIIIVSTLSTYAVGIRFVEEPEIVALIVLVVTTILLVIAILITRSFERLAEANRMKSEFVSVVSHQLRSPLSNLKWVTELLISSKTKMSSQKQLEYLQILRENNERMQNLISDLLIVARIEQGKLPPQKKKVSLDALVREAVKDVELFAQASNVKLTLSVKGTLPQILADESQLKPVIENLLDNAIRYTEEKKKVEVTLSKKGNNLYFEVRDQGVGIPKEEQKHIFQKFFRSKNALRQQTEGSGLGLYIAKSIINKSGGEIEFFSQEGKGSTFFFTLPIK